MHRRKNGKHTHENRPRSCSFFTLFFQTKMHLNLNEIKAALDGEESLMAYALSGVMGLSKPVKLKFIAKYPGKLKAKYFLNSYTLLKTWGTTTRYLLANLPVKRWYWSFRPLHHRLLFWANKTVEKERIKLFTPFLNSLLTGLISCW